MKRSTPLQRRTPLRRKTALKRGGPLKRSGSMKRTGMSRRGKPLKQTRRQETAAETRARLHFFDTVLAVDPLICFFADVTLAGKPRRPKHVCGGNDGELDPHHLIAKSWIQRYFGDLPDDELLAIKYAPIIGCPLCRNAHDALPANLNPGARVYFEELDEDLIDFCERIDRRYAGTGRRSLLARLRHECPPRPLPEVGAAAGFGQQLLAGAGAGRSGGIAASARSGEANQIAGVGGDGSATEPACLPPRSITSEPCRSPDSGDRSTGDRDQAREHAATSPAATPPSGCDGPVAKAPGAASPDHSTAGDGAEAGGAAACCLTSGSSAVSGGQSDQQATRREEP